MNENEVYFWRKSYDAGLKDINPKEFEKTTLDCLLPTFRDFPDKLALDYLGVKITYKQLDIYSNQFANMLIKNGFNVGDIVGINLANIPQYIIAWLGAIKAGCVISGVSPLLSQDELAYQLKDLSLGGKNVCLVTLDAIFEHRFTPIAKDVPNVKLVVYTSVGSFLSKLKQKLGKLLKKIPFGIISPIEGKTLIDFMEILKTGPTDMPKVAVKPSDLYLIQYTGGTTGASKGCMLTHRCSVADILIVQTYLDWIKGRGKYIALSGFPFFHIAGLFFCVNAIFLGWTQILIPNPRDTNYICSKMKEYRPNYLVNVPSLFQMLIANPKFKTLDHSQLLNCITAASPFPKESQELLESIIGPGKLIECYGMTETGPLTTMNPSKGAKKLGSIGLPLLNTMIKLVDPATSKEVPIGEPGEICTKGPQLMDAYYYKPEETKHAVDSDGFMHTGDVAIFDKDGFLRIVDRTKDMIIVGGYKVFSKKAEDALAQHPKVDMIAMVGVPNPERPGSELVKVYITLKPGAVPEGGEAAFKVEFEKYAKEQLAPYEVPKFIEIRKELPLTAVGKVDKKALRKEAKK